MNLNPDIKLSGRFKRRRGDSIEPSESGGRRSWFSRRLRFSLPRPHLALPRPRLSLPRPRFSVPRPRLSVSLPRPRFSLPRPHFSVPRPHLSLPRPRLSLPRPRFPFRRKPKAAEPFDEFPSNDDSSGTRLFFGLSLPEKASGLGEDAAEEPAPRRRRLRPSLPLPRVSLPKLPRPSRPSINFSLRRKSKSEPFDEFQTDESPAEAKKRFSLSLRRRPKEPKEPKEPKLRKTRKGKERNGAPQLGLPIMRAFNLLPRDEARDARLARPRTAQLALAVVGLVGIAGLGSVFMILNAGVSDKRLTRDELEVYVRAAQAANVAEPVEPGVDPAVVEEQSVRTAALSTTLSTRVAWDRVMRELSLVTPDDVWLSGIVAQPGIPPESTAPDGEAAALVPAVPSVMTVNGFANNQDGVARFLARLSVVPELTGVQLLSSTHSLIGETEVVSFSVSALVKLPGASTA